MPFAHNDSVEIHYETEGNGPPLVLHHGATDSLQTWYERGYVDALKGSHSLILIDARGHGQSGKPQEPEAYVTETMARDVIAVLDQTVRWRTVGVVLQSVGAVAGNGVPVQSM